MRKAPHIAALLVLSLALGACAQGSGTVEGLVVERQRQIAVEGALVHIESLEGDGTEQIVLTDINGLYRFADVPKGLNRVTVIKEGYGTDPTSCGGCRKFADVVEDQDLVLDFQLDFITRSVFQSVLVRVSDDRGRLPSASINLYRGPCVGSSNDCFRTFPTDPSFIFDGLFVTGADGTVSVPFAGTAPINEFSDYHYQLRVTAPDHQNRLFDVVLNIDNIPATLDLFLPRL